MTAPQLRDVRARLRKTREVTAKTVTRLRRKLIKTHEVANQLWKLEKKTAYWEGKLNGLGCPARESIKETRGFYVCHCKTTNDPWTRSKYFKDFYPQCRSCPFSYDEKLKAGCGAEWQEDSHGIRMILEGNSK